MIKYDLREKGFNVDFKEPKESRINFIWAVLTLAIIALTFLGVVKCAKEFAGVDAYDPLAPVLGTLTGLFGLPMGVLICFISLFSIYFLLKSFIAVLMCKEKAKSVSVKMLRSKGMMMLHCKEALKVWQVIIIYTVPVAILYFSLFALSVVSGGTHILYFPMLVLLSFFMAFDIVVVLYVLFYKIKDGADYISIDRHVYQMSTFNRACYEENEELGENEMQSAKNS